METAAFSPTRLFAAALMLGAGVYLIQRGRFLIPALMTRSPYLRARPAMARALVMGLLLVGVLAAGMGCRVLMDWLF